MMTPWLTIVGIGEDGVNGLSPAAQRAVTQAEILVGGRRHLDLAGPSKAECVAWPAPLHQALPWFKAWRGRNVVVLASGDPFFHGIGSLLAETVEASEIHALPAPSAYSLAANRLGWAGQDCARISLHGRALEKILPYLHPGRRILALSWDHSTPLRLARLLTERGFADSEILVLEALGGARERIRRTTAANFALTDIDPLNLLALEIRARPGTRIISFAAGLPDDWFETDGQITKREIRALTLSSLQPRFGALLWDIGAGSGSISIEWMLSDPSCRAIAIEENAERCARIDRNALSLGVPDLIVRQGRAPEALHTLAPPDAVFVGGGATPSLLETAMAALRDQGRLVVNAVTIETLGLVADHHRNFGGALVHVAIARAAPVGSYQSFRPALPIVQWTWIKQEAKS